MLHVFLSVDTGSVEGMQAVSSLVNSQRSYNKSGKNMDFEARFLGSNTSSAFTSDVALGKSFTLYASISLFSQWGNSEYSYGFIVSYESTFVKYYFFKVYFCENGAWQAHGLLEKKKKKKLVLKIDAYVVNKNC